MFDSRRIKLFARVRQHKVYVLIREESNYFPELLRLRGNKHGGNYCSCLQNTRLATGWKTNAYRFDRHIETPCSIFYPALLQC